MKSINAFCELAKIMYVNLCEWRWFLHKQEPSLFIIWSIMEKVISVSDERNIID